MRKKNPGKPVPAPVRPMPVVKIVPRKPPKPRAEPPPVRVVKYRVYSDAERAGALLAVEANGGNVSKTARELGIPMGTLDTWVKRDTPAHLLKFREEMRGDLQQALRVLVWQLAGGITPDKIHAAPLHHLATSFSNLFDKMRALEGKPSSGPVDLRSLNANVDLTKLAPDELQRIIDLFSRPVAGDASQGDGGAGPPQPAGLPYPRLSGGGTGAGT